MAENVGVLNLYDPPRSLRGMSESKETFLGFSQTKVRRKHEAHSESQLVELYKLAHLSSKMRLIPDNLSSLGNSANLVEWSSRQTNLPNVNVSLREPEH